MVSEKIFTINAITMLHLFHFSHESHRVGELGRDSGAHLLLTNCVYKSRQAGVVWDERDHYITRSDSLYSRIHLGEKDGR